MSPPSSSTGAISVNLCTDPSHACRGCHPERFPTTAAPMHEGHLAGRWKDKVEGSLRVTVDGIDLTRHIWECVLGRKGYAYVFVRHEDQDCKEDHCQGYLCKTAIHCTDLCATVIRGHVTAATTGGEAGGRADRD